MTKVGVITQARMTSTRLPGKVLIPLAGRSVLEHHISRLASAHVPVIVATTTNADDDAVVSAAQAMGVPSYRGSEQDVLSRFVGAADALELDVIVRVTSDCPLVDGSLVRTGIDAFLSLDDPSAYVSNTMERSYPRGFDFEVFGAEALREAHARADQPAEREHVTPYLYSRTTHSRVTRSIVRSADASAYRLTLDTEDDLALLRLLFEEHGAADLDVEQLISLLDDHPEIARMNAHIEQKKLED